MLLQDGFMVKKVFDYFGTFLVVIAVILAVLLVGVRVIGYKPYTVLSPSMTPKYKPGDLVYVKSTESENIEKGDVITFLVSEDTVVTHRVDEVDRKNRRFYTKGDANDFRDGEPVLYENVIGKVSFSLPKLGYVSQFFSTAKGRYIGLMALCIIILMFIIPELFKTKKQKAKHNNSDNSEE